MTDPQALAATIREEARKRAEKEVAYCAKGRYAPTRALPLAEDVLWLLARLERAEAALREIANADHWIPPFSAQKKVVRWIETARAVLAGDAQPAATDDYRAYMEQKADLDPEQPPMNAASGPRT